MRNDESAYSFQHYCALQLRATWERRRLACRERGSAKTGPPDMQRTWGRKLLTRLRLVGRRAACAPSKEHSLVVGRIHWQAAVVLKTENSKLIYIHRSSFDCELYETYRLDFNAS